MTTPPPKKPEEHDFAEVLKYCPRPNIGGVIFKSRSGYEREFSEWAVRNEKAIRAALLQAQDVKVVGVNAGLIEAVRTMLETNEISSTAFSAYKDFAKAYIDSVSAGLVLKGGE